MNNSHIQIKVSIWLFRATHRYRPGSDRARVNLTIIVDSRKACTGTIDEISPYMLKTDRRKYYACTFVNRMFNLKIRVSEHNISNSTAKFLFYMRICVLRKQYHTGQAWLE